MVEVSPIDCFDIGLKGNIVENGTIMGVSWNGYAYYLRCDPIVFINGRFLCVPQLGLKGLCQLCRFDPDVFIF